QLTEMVAGHHNDAPYQTAFTISIDAKENLTTGISARERLQAVRLLTNPKARAEDFVRPGHVFPLLAKEGGVLTRAGHTEAAVDLMILADLPAVGVIGELVNDDGTVKKGAQLATFALDHNLLTITIADLIAYRQSREKLLTRRTSCSVLPLVVAGQAITAQVFTYDTIFDSLPHYALVLANSDAKKNMTTTPAELLAQHIAAGEAILTRLHVEQMPDDIFWPMTMAGLMGASKQTAAASEPTMQNNLQRALAILARQGMTQPTVLIYLRRGAVGINGGDNKPADAPTSDQTRQRIWREVGVGAQIARDLGIKKLNLLAHHEKQYLGLSGFDLTISSFTQL
ncbi:MAG: 3,4-dihydroxy-2-butanone-4-phosphate synthase, partial [Alphaproteobacteria bacterium]|nr:3,4-dihydroxy-2-butanone-4-phosphate synthase [Alphaproteobacteria bacterium]